MKKEIIVLASLFAVSTVAFAVVHLGFDVTKENEKEQGLDFTIKATPQDDGRIVVYVYIPLKGKLKTVSSMSIVANDNKKLLFAIPLSFAVVTPQGAPDDAPKQIEAWPITISETLIDKCSLHVCTDGYIGAPWYRIKLSSYVSTK